VAEDASLSESLALFKRLSAHGHELDDELKRLEREPDRATVASLLPGLRERTERITHSAESLRWAARDRAQKFADDDLDALSTQIDVEAGALRHWSGAETPDADAPKAAHGSQASWPDAGTGDGVVPEQTWADLEAGSESGAQSRTGSGAGTGAQAGPGHTVAEQPPAITARDPRQQTTYPWQKSARPETTN
jgi:hypothetical protein